MNSKLTRFSDQQGQRAAVEGEAIALQILQRSVHGHLRQSVPAPGGLLVASDGAHTTAVEPSQGLQLGLAGWAGSAVLDQVLHVLELLRQGLLRRLCSGGASFAACDG